MTYDGFGRMLSATDSLGHVIKKRYNAQGQVTDITDPAGNIAHNVYDLAGHVIQSWALPVSGDHYLLSSARYNAAGERLWNAGEEGQHTVFTYTDTGRLNSVTTPAGHTFSLQYNDAGLPVKKWVDGKLILHIRYDVATARIAEQIDFNGRTTFTYDADGLIRQLIHSGKNDYPDYQLKWQYDKNRRVTTVTDVAGNKINTTYDVQGRTAQISYQFYNEKSEILVRSVYDDFSRITLLHYGSGMERKLYYDAFGRRLKISDTLLNKPLSASVFQYDANDNITTLVKYNEQQQYAHLYYQYDALNNLLSMTCDGSSDLPLCPRDTTSTIFTGKNAPVITRQHYIFTPLNRLASVRERLQNPVQHLTLSKIMQYGYTDTAVPLRLQQISTTWNLKSPLVRYFHYDAMSNMTTDGEGDHILYNASNQIVQVIKPNGTRSDYAYDGSGREVKETSNMGVHYLFYYQNKLLNEQINTPEKATHLIGYLGVAKTIDGHITEYEENNYKGDIVGILTKEQGSHHPYTLWQRNIYSPYGMVFHNCTAAVPTYKKTLVGFDGERTDPVTGWQFLGAGHRTYNPGQRYFVSEDPSGGGYGFGSNNPIMNTDPSGNIPQWAGGMFKWFGYISSFGLNALHAKWANIAGAVMMGGLTTATLGATAATYGGTVLASVVTGSAVYGTIPVIAAAIPSNKGLNIAASVMGLTQMAATVATTAFSAGMFLSSLAEAAVQKAIYMEMLPYEIIGETGSFRSNIIATTLPIINGLLYNLLKKNVPELIVQEMYLRCFKTTSVNAVWKIISKTPFNAKCDTATLLLVAKHHRMKLPIFMLEMFLMNRREYVRNIDTGAYLNLLTSVLSGFSGRETKNKLGGGVFRIFKNTNYEGFLTQSIPYFGDTAVVTSGNHITIMERQGNFIGVYHMDKNAISHTAYTIDHAEHYFLTVLNPTNFLHHGYMALTNPLDTLSR